jgi:GntR family transcriptional repressor for pyruvate dehydrogenase complex
MSNPTGSLIDGVVFRPVRSGNALEDTVGRLMQTIRLGVVEPGNALPSERDLAARFSVSRDTVREAIRELGEAGYLTAKRGRYGGTFVADPLPPPPSELAVVPAAQEVEDLLGLREILEVGAVRAASARSLGAEDRALLWTRLGEVQASGPDDYRRLDSRLHLAFAEIVGVPSLVTLIADNRSRVNELLDTFPLLARAIEHSNRQHEAIVFAILAGNEQGAAEAMREHLEASGVLLRGFLA